MAQARRSTTRRTPAKRAAAKPAAELAVKRSVVRTFLLYLISGGLYAFYWFYVTRQAVTKEVGGNDQVGLQTAGLIVPILNIFIIYWLFRDIDKLHRKAGLSGFPAVWFVVGPLIGAFIPIVNVFVGIVSIVLFGLVVKYLNEYWDKSTNGKATEAKVTGGEIAVAVAGLVITALFLILGVAAAIFGNKASTELDKIQEEINNSGYVEQSGDGNVPAQEIYDKVQTGMSKAQVKDVAGGKDGASCTSSSSQYTGTIETCFYNGVSVTFQDDKVTNKTKY